MLKVLFITTVSHEGYMVNLNHYQRAYFLSRQAHLTIFGRKGADFSLSTAKGTEIVRAPFKIKLGVILACFFWMITRGRSRQYDIILTEPSKLCICGLFGKIILGTKWVMDVWDIPFRCKSHFLRSLVARMDRKIARALFKFADFFILSILPDYEFAEFGIPRDKMLSLRNAIWLDDATKRSSKENRTSKRPFKILCMRSRFTRDMGLDLLAQAFDLLNEVHADVEIIVVGKIPKKLRPQIALLTGRTNVRFSEFVEHNELLSLIMSSSACVIPFRNTVDLAQTYPIKVLEYLSCGSVVIAANLPGIASMISHGNNGLLFEPGDAADLAEKLRTLYIDPEYAAMISSRATSLSEKFDCRNKAEVILAAFEKLCVR